MREVIKGRIEEVSDLSTSVVRKATSKEDGENYFIETPYSEVDYIDWMNEVENG